MTSIQDATHEMHIQYLGARMKMSMDAGNRQEADSWMQAQVQAITKRSPEQQARMTAAIDRAIDEGVNYFAACGACDGTQMKAEARHA